MINITVTETAIEITGMPVRPTTVEGDEIARALSEAVGYPLGAVKLSGYWIIGNTTDGWSPVFGHQPGGQVRSFTKALAGATGKKIITHS